jgi:hypothetical protein
VDSLQRRAEDFASSDATSFHAMMADLSNDGVILR